MKPTFATNTEEQRVADALNDYLGDLLNKYAEPFDVDISTAYFNPETSTPCVRFDAAGCRTGTSGSSA